jgi:Cytidylate kinase-like family
MDMHHYRTVSQLVDRACREWEARRQAAEQSRIALEKSAAFTIALAREAGTQGTLVAQQVGKLLGWQVWDNELLERVAQDMGLRTRLLKSVDERQQSWLVEIAEAFLSAPLQSKDEPPVTEIAFVDHLVKTVLTLGIHGECIIVGRGAGFILPPETTLRVRLLGPERDRITAISRIEGISDHEAARQVRIIDRERTAFVRKNFSKDPTDPRHYDLILNAPRLSVGQRAEVIVEALRRFHAAENAAIQVLS